MLEIQANRQVLDNMIGKRGFDGLKKRAIVLAKRLAQVNEWVVAGLVLVFIGLLLIPSFSLAVKREPLGVSSGKGGVKDSFAPGTVRKTVTVSVGDTLIGILSRVGVQGQAADSLVSSLAKSFGPDDLQPGQKINLFMRSDVPDGIAQLAALRIDVDPAEDVVASLTDDGSYDVKVVAEKLTARPVLVRGTITSTLYDSASGAGLPPSVLMEMVEAFSFDVDFESEVQAGTSYEVLYDRNYDRSGKYAGDGPILFAALDLPGSELKIYHYTMRDGTSDYFDPEGRSVRKTLMRTPVEDAWLTSGYGYRNDPFTGLRMFHPGLDLAVPFGTPIMAAGDGVVLLAAYNDAYGNFVKLRHRNGYTTLYAHMRAFARGIEPGARVVQGQVIGYVGLTGMTTGPHVHYEVEYNGQYVNPQTVSTPPGPTLTGAELDRFEAAKARVDRIYDLLSAEGSKAS